MESLRAEGKRGRALSASACCRAPGPGAVKNGRLYPGGAWTHAPYNTRNSKTPSQQLIRIHVHGDKNVFWKCQVLQDRFHVATQAKD